jgi:glyoxylase-like metal-dependent hydrolase (beta-lactamase superfamily II)
VRCRAGGAAWAWWDRHRQDPWLRLQQRVQRRLQALGVAVLPYHGPRARAQLVRQTLGTRAEALAAELEALDRQRYGSAKAPRRPDAGISNADGQWAWVWAWVWA